MTVHLLLFVVGFPRNALSCGPGLFTLPLFGAYDSSDLHSIKHGCMYLTVCLQTYTEVQDNLDTVKAEQEVREKLNWLPDLSR